MALEWLVDAPLAVQLALHPAVLVGLAAILAWRLPQRTLGHALGIVATLAGAAIAWFAPDPNLQVTLFGEFPAVLFHLDPVSRLMGLIFGFIGAVAVGYSWASGADRTQTAIALSYVASSLGAVLAGDWLTLLYCWELMAVTSTLLVWHRGGAAVRAGFRYALVHGIGGSLLLAAVVWHYVETGTLLLDETGGIAGGIPALLAALGIGVNVGFVGFHAWLPDTYPRPHVAASVFLCVYTTKTGVYAMFRAFPDGHAALAMMGGAMAVFGAFAALLQGDMRRLLSYHIQSQVGYMIAGVGLGTALSTAGAFGHVFNHILYKSLLFMTVGVVIYRTGEEHLDDVGGLWRAMPITAGTFAIAALSIAGFPGFNGFVSKGMVLVAAHHGHEGYHQVLWWLLLIGGVGTFLSFIKLGYHAFLHGDYAGQVRDATTGQSVGMVAVAGLCLLLGLYPPALYGLLPDAAAIPGEATELHYTAYTVSHVLESLALATAGLVGFVLLKGALHRVGTVPDVDWLYNRAGFYGTRGVVLAVTELGAAVDAAAVRVARVSTAVATEPEAAVRRAPGAASLLGEPGERYAPLRAGIGGSVLLLALVATGLLAFLLLFGA